MPIWYLLVWVCKSQYDTYMHDMYDFFRNVTQSLLISKLTYVSTASQNLKAVLC